MAEILIGTSGYDYPEWRGILYPAELSRERFLACYADQFQALELNYTYYGMPEESQMESFVRRSNQRLRFSVKAHRSLTHEISLSSWRDQAKRFSEALLPLSTRNLLLSVLLQFPSMFRYDVDERRYLDALVTELAPLPLAVEFRHASWQNERVYKACSDKGLSWCIVDAPSLSGMPSRLPVVTGKASYIRFHGRNADRWYGSNSRDRYDYLYTDGELESALPMINAISASTELVQIFFNNHAKGQAVVNARKMKLLTARKLD